MGRMPLVEHDKPRILTIDFSPSDVKKLQMAGFDVRRATTGIHAPGVVCIPCSPQDVEIALFECHKGAFDNIATREISEESVLKGPFFRAVLHEVWNKYGWTIFFVKEGFTPADFEWLGIFNLGVVENNGYYIPASPYKEASQKDQRFEPKQALFPVFVGESIHVKDDSEESKALARFIHSSEYRILDSKFKGHERNTYNNEITVFNEASTKIWLIYSESTNTEALAIRLSHIRQRYNPYKPYRYDEYHGGSLILPDFKTSNADVALALINDAISSLNPEIFSEPRHEWLKNYRPYPTSEIAERREEVISEAAQKIQELEKTIESLADQYSWLDQLLCARDDDFTEAAAKALEFLGFGVQRIDHQLAPGQRRREDLHVIDRSDNYFTLGEAKSTHRGASEDFLTRVQNHQGRYLREHNCPIPSAILIVNHSYDLPPDRRPTRLYTEQAILDRLTRYSCMTSVKGYSRIRPVLSRRGRLYEREVAYYHSPRKPSA
jgi:hypothetical protein